MTIPLNLEGAFSSKEALHEMIVHRKVCFDRAHFGAPSGRHVQELVVIGECLLKQLGVRRGSWEEQKTESVTAEEFCEGHRAPAEIVRDSGA